MARSNENVVTGTAEHGIIAGATDEVVAARTTPKDVHIRPAAYIIGAVAAEETIQASAAANVVVAKIFFADHPSAGVGFVREDRV